MAQDFVWQDGERVMFIGDTVSEDAQGYTRLVPAMVTARYPDRQISYTPRMMGGNRIGDVIERWDDIFTGGPMPTYITVSLGLNDVMHPGMEHSPLSGATGTPLGRFRDLYNELMLRLRDTGATIACFTTTVVGEDLRNEANKALVGYNDAIREIAFRHGANVVDMNTAFHDAITSAQAVNPNFRYTTDGIHLDTYGHYLMAMTLLDALHFGLEMRRAA